MACYHPSSINVQRRATSESASRFDSVKVPCGKCLGCRTDQGRDWTIRIVHESSLHPLSSWFATFTYHDAHIPGTFDEDPRQFGSLDPEDMRLFVRRLRKRTKNKVGYYICGEYGDTTDRPHYHAALFGVQFLDRVQVGERSGIPVYRSEMLEAAWPLGHCEISPLSAKSASYVAGYVTKKAHERVDPRKHLRVDTVTGEIVRLVPEFSRQSRRPALGRTWLEKNWEDVYPRDFVMLAGTPFKPPRYYDKRMEDICPELMEEVRFQRWKDIEEIGDEKLIMAEKIHRSRVKLFEQRGKV